MSKAIKIPHNFQPRSYQMGVWEYMIQPQEGLRGSVVWHRRGGKDLTSLNLCAYKAFQRVGTYWHLLPTYKQGRAIVWEGMRGDGIPFLDSFPKQLVTRKNNVEMQLDLANGSKYRVIGTDNIDSLVGTNPVGCVFSEYSLQDPRAWDYLRPILAENGGWALFIFTPRGRNHGYKLHMMAEENPNWFAQTLSVPQTKAIPMSAVDEERAAGMPEELIQQEFFCSWDAPLVGAYFSNQMANAQRENRIREVPWEPRIPVNTYWDLGMDDSTSIWFVQFYLNEVRVIDYYENSGEGLAHYAKVLGERPYVYGAHWAPWDIEVRELGTGETRRKVAASLGIKFNVIPKHEIADGIECARNFIPKCYFDKIKCSHGIEALKSYRKQYDEKLKAYRSQPLHDWASHAADSFRGLAWVHRRGQQPTRSKSKSTIDDYEYI